MKWLTSFALLFFIGVQQSFAGYCLSGERGCKHNLSIERYLRDDLAANSSGFAVVEAIGTTFGTDGSISQRKNINAILITENASWNNDRNKPTVVITGAIHGNEWATPEVGIGIAEYLLENKDNKSPAVDDKGGLIVDYITGSVKGAHGQEDFAPRITSIKELLQVIQVIIIPILNPDGYDYSHSPPGRKAYGALGWRSNRRLQGLTATDQLCYDKDGVKYPTPPVDAEHCYLADYDETASGGDIEEEWVVVCENGKSIYLFEPDLSVASKDMFDAIYDSTSPKRVFCASKFRRIWDERWELSEENFTRDLAKAKAEGYIQPAYGIDLNRNFGYKWDLLKGHEKNFIRVRSPSSRIFRGEKPVSEPEVEAMVKLVQQRNVFALIDYHSGSTQVLYPYAYSTREHVKKNVLAGSNSRTQDYELLGTLARKIAAMLNKHDREDEAISDYTPDQNYNNIGVGSGVSRDWYYHSGGFVPLNIEVHEQEFIYEDSVFRKVVPEICRNNVPGAIWLMFWVAEQNLPKQQADR